MKLQAVGKFFRLTYGDNPAFEIELSNGSKEIAFRQGGIAIWAFPSRPKMPRENVVTLENQLNFMLDEMGEE